MKRYILLVLFLLTLLPLNPLSAADECLPIDDSLSPDFTYETPDGSPNFDNLIPQVTDYLNNGGDADALPDFFAGVEGDEARLLESMSSQVYAVNVDDDAEDELVIAVAVIHFAVWSGGVLLYDCEDATYNLIGQVDLENNSYRDWGFELFEVADHTGDGQPEYYVHSDVGLRYISFEAFVWDGEAFAPLLWTTTFADEPLSGMVANGLLFPDVDADGQVEAQLSFGADIRERFFAYVDIYRIRDESFQFDCQIYLGGEPSYPNSQDDFLIATVEEADSYFRCGYDDVAEPLFRLVVDDDSLAEFDFGSGTEFFERENLRAFSLYRLVLLNGRRGDPEATAEAYAQLNAEFPVEVPGSNYTSMAEAFWLEYEQSADWEVACDALAAHIEPTVAAILQDDERFARALYISPYAGFPGKRPNAMIRGCPDHDIAAGFPDPARPGMLPTSP